MIFSFVTSPAEGLKQCHEWVKCRDFLHDAVRVQITGSPCAIFGFRFSKEANPPIDLTKIRMLVSKNGLTEKEIDGFNLKMKCGLKIVRCFEKIAVVKPSILKKMTPDEPKYKAVYMFVGDKMWIKSPFMLSLYTFLIRLGDKEIAFKTSDELNSALGDLAKKAKSNNNNDNDLSYLTVCYKNLFTVAEKHESLFLTDANGMHDIYTKPIDINSFHGYSGILSLSNKSTCDKTFNQKLQEVLPK